MVSFVLGVLMSMTYTAGAGHLVRLGCSELDRENSQVKPLPWLANKKPLDLREYLLPLPAHLELRQGQPKNPKNIQDQVNRSTDLDAVWVANVDLAGFRFEFDETLRPILKWPLQHFCSRLSARALDPAAAHTRALSYEFVATNFTSVVRVLEVQCPQCSRLGLDLPYLGMDESYELTLTPALGSYSLADKSNDHSESAGEGPLDSTQPRSLLVAESRHGLNRGLQTLLQLLSALPELPKTTSQVCAVASDGICEPLSLPSSSSRTIGHWVPGIPAQMVANAKSNEQQANTAPEIVSLIVQDRPQFPWRGLMVDCARHFMPMTLLERILVDMATSKLNVLHLHLTDSTAFALDLPAFGSDGTSIEANSTGRLGMPLGPGMSYSTADIAHLVAFAANLSVRVVPELDLPAHAAAWAPDVDETISKRNSLEHRRSCSNSNIDESEDQDRPPLVASCDLPHNLAVQFGHADRPALKRLDLASLSPAATHPSASEVASHAIRHVAALFPDQYMHLGGDEVDLRCWTHDPVVAAALAKQGLTPREALHKFFVDVVTVANEAGKDVLLWQDTFDQVGYGPGAFGSSDISEREGAEDHSSSSSSAALWPPGVKSGSPLRVHVQPWKCWHEGHRTWQANGMTQALMSGQAAAAQAVQAGRGVVASTCWYLDWDSQWVDFLEHSPASGAAAGVSSSEGSEASSVTGSRNSAMPPGLWGGEAALWTELVDFTNAECRLWPRAAAIAERLWSHDHRNYLDPDDNKSSNPNQKATGSSSRKTSAVDAATVSAVRKRLEWHARRLSAAGTQLAPISDLNTGADLSTAQRDSQPSSLQRDRHDDSALRDSGDFETTEAALDRALRDVATACPLLDAQEIQRPIQLWNTWLRK